MEFVFGAIQGYQLFDIHKFNRKVKRGDFLPKIVLICLCSFKLLVLQWFIETNPFSSST